MSEPDPRPWIKDGICINDGTFVCDLGYACDGCPFYSILPPAKVR
jgi:hypothetical protein